MQPKDQQGSDRCEARPAGLQVFDRAANRRSSADDIVNYCGALAANAGAKRKSTAVPTASVADPAIPTPENPWATLGLTRRA